MDEKEFRNILLNIEEKLDDFENYLDNEILKEKYKIIMSELNENIVKLTSIIKE